MRRLRKADQRRLRAFPRWLHVPCVRPFLRNADIYLCAKPGLVYQVSDKKQLIFQFGSRATKMALCPRHRDQVIAHGRSVKLCPGAVQFQHLKESLRK